MRFITVSFLLLFIIQCIQAQTGNKPYNCTFYFDSISNRTIYTETDKMPDCKNCGLILNRLISNINPDYKPKNDKGHGTISLIVETSGKVTNVRIIDSVSEQVDRQVVEFFKRTNDWICGYCKGVPVPVEIQIQYQL
jgi:hypothetical protein